MKTATHRDDWVLVIAAALVGSALGYLQDGLTQRIVSLFVAPVAEAFYVAGLCGWVVFVLWYIAALKFPSLRKWGLQPGLGGLISMLVLFGFTVAGGVGFFVLNGMDYQTLSQVTRLSALSASVYNFALVLLPIIAIHWVRAAMLKPPAAP